MIETYYVHLEFRAKTGVWSINLPFLCTKCGVCCTLDDFLVAGKIHGSPQINHEVYAKFYALTESLGELFEKDEIAYDQYVTRTKCPFQVGTICSIYEIRPDGCRQFPNTVFGMLSEDCQALNRFKKQMFALKRGRVYKETGHFTVDPIVSVIFSEKQYINCLDKLRHVGVTEDELALFISLNKIN
ncbi:MAG: YkgJ family cysteine cluster protein [Candidatus Bathyarchaeota archaeon]|nr:YkgJ family cysteine cluster protein [Candidatus Termiticorpusculum sp.]